MTRNRMLILMLAAFAAACNDAIVAPAEGPVVGRVSIVPLSEIALDVDSVLQLSAVAYTADGIEIPGRAATWTTDQDAVARVTPTGVVIGRSGGAATITATIAGITAHKSVIVRARLEPVQIASVVVSPAETILEAGSARQLVASVFAADGTELFGRAVTWTSSNEDLAAVDSLGKVMARRAGVALITASSEGRHGQARIMIPSVSPLWSEAPLTQIDGSPLPVVSWTGNIIDENGIEVVRTIRVVAGHLRVNLTDRAYEQQFTMERWEDVYDIVNGQPVFRGVQRKETKTFDDRGTVTPLYDGVAILAFHSTERVAHQFSGIQTERGFDVTQRINGSGAVLSLRFAR